MAFQKEVFLLLPLTISFQALLSGVFFSLSFFFVFCFNFISALSFLLFALLQKRQQTTKPINFNTIGMSTLFKNQRQMTAGAKI